MDRNSMSVQTVRMVSVKDFEAGAHDSVLNVISLTAGPLKSFTGTELILELNLNVSAC